MTALSPPNDPGGRFIHYGMREHGMAAAMNGMALHGGIIPYSGTFLVFSDYCRPAIRLAALMGQRVIHVMTHDSIGLGEDGPTHQPVEHLAALRAIPNLHVFRPCDAVETDRVLAARAASARPPERARADAPEPAAVAQGRARHATAARPAPTRSLAGRERRGASLAVRHRLGSRDRGRGAEASCRAAASPRAWSRCRASSCLRRRPDASAATSSATAQVNVAVEAAIRQGWDAIIGSDGVFVGMTGFGASAPYKDLYQAFRHYAREGGGSRTALRKRC